jgi:hypothetical protein
MVVIRSAAAELEHVGLEDGLAICLAFLDLEPETYPRAASRWAARLTLEHNLAVGERVDLLVGAWLERKGLSD